MMFRISLRCEAFRLAFAFAIPVVMTGVCLADNRNAQQASQSGEHQAQSAQDETKRSSDLVDRGKYLVHQVAMCIHCHTPHDDEGNLEQIRLLQGAPMPVRSPFAAQQWAFTAPNLAGLPGGFSEQDVVRLLKTGKSPTGDSPKPPMPPYRMTEEDAQAVAAYLKSIRR